MVRRLLSVPAMRSLVSISIILALAACDGGPPSGDGGPPLGDDARPPSPSVCGDLFGGAPTEGGGLLVGERDSGAFVSFDDDHEAVYAWGFQGGTMILPMVGVPLAVAGDERCFEVTLRHLPDPDAPEAFGPIADFPMVTLELDTTVEGDATWTPPIFDQLGYTGLDGVRLLLEVTVRGQAFSLRHTVALALVANAPPECRALESTGGGGGSCGYRIVPGEGVVESVAAYTASSGEPTCPDPQEVTVRFEPTDPATAVCYESFLSDPVTTNVLISGYLRPPASCLTDVAVGSRIPMELQVIEGGTCQPIVWTFDLPDCEAACPP